MLSAQLKQPFAFAPALLVVLLSLFTSACDSASELTDRGQLVASAQAWFHANAPTPGTGKNGADEINVFYPNWEAGTVVETSTGERAVVTTLWRKTAVTYREDTYFLRVLAVVMNASGEVSRGRIVEFASPDSIGREEGPTLVKQWLENALQGRFVWVAEYDVQHTFVRGMRYAPDLAPAVFEQKEEQCEVGAGKTTVITMTCYSWETLGERICTATELGKWHCTQYVYRQTYCWESDSPGGGGRGGDGGGGSGGGGGGSGNTGSGDGGYQSVTLSEGQKAALLVARSPYALLDNVPCSQLASWQMTAQRSPSDAVISELSGRGIQVQTLGAASGAVVNMDYYSVTVRLGQGQYATELLNSFRTNTNAFINTSISDFQPYDAPGEYGRMMAGADGYLMTIFLKVPYVNFNALADRGTVVGYGNMANSWTFATAHSPNDGGHPVSGNRTFGYTSNGDGSYTFYTRGVDRMTNWFDNAFQQSFGTPFSAADALWTSAMNGIAANVRANGGTATVNAAQRYQPDWNKVKGVLRGTTAASAFTGCRNGILVQ